MRSTARSIVTVAAASATLLVGAGLVAAKAIFKPLSITAWIIQPPSGGEQKCVGGSLTGTWPPCTPGGKYFARDHAMTMRQVSDDPLATGTRTVFSNVNIDENGQGHIWGTWILVLDNGKGRSEGTFTGTFHGWFGALDGEVVGHGTEGDVDGMQTRLLFAWDHFPINPATLQPGIETDTGYRLEPKGE